MTNDKEVIHGSSQFPESSRRQCGLGRYGLSLSRAITRRALAGGTSRNQEASIQVRDGILYIDTPTQTAVMEKGILTSLKSKQTGEVYIGG